MSSEWGRLFHERGTGPAAGSSNLVGPRVLSLHAEGRLKDGLQVAWAMAADVGGPEGMWATTLNVELRVSAGK